MTRQAYTQIKVARPALTNSLFTHTRNPYGLTFANPRWNTSRQSLCRGLASSRVGTLQGNSTLRALQHLFKRNQDIAFDIPAAASKCGSPGRLGFRAAEASKTTKASAATEKLFKEIAEAGTAEPELECLLAARTTSSMTVPARWRLAPFSPSRTKLVIFPTILRIAQDFVRFVNFLEFFFRSFLVFGHVRVVSAGQFAKGFFDLLIAGVARNAEDLVVIFEFDGHGAVLPHGFNSLTWSAPRSPFTSHFPPSSPSSFESGTDSNVSWSSLKLTVTRLFSGIAPARICRDKTVSKWRCRNRFNGLAP